MSLSGQQAAQQLLGRKLRNGWIVTKKLANPIYDKGGVFSCCYEVEKDDKKGFLKAFDYSAILKAGVDDVAKYMQDLLSAYNVEREILERCTQYRCKNVVELLESGFEEIEDISIPRVEYLILEYADVGDLSDVLNENQLKMEWKLRSLHQLFKGINQIHKIEITHQDIKPTNIVLKKDATTKKDVTKLSDFGSAIPLDFGVDKLPNRLKGVRTGSWEYAPPELLYGELHADLRVARIGCDLYLLGSMVVFYFIGLNMNALIRKNLIEELCWTRSDRNQGRYKEILPYLVLAFEKSLADLSNEIKDDFVRKDVVEMVRYLCNPDPAQRGHKRNFAESGSRFDLQRFITTLDVLATRYSIRNK